MPTTKSEIELKAWRSRKELPILNFDNQHSWTGDENNLFMFDENCYWTALTMNCQHEHSLDQSSAKSWLCHRFSKEACSDGTSHQNTSQWHEPKWPSSYKFSSFFWYTHNWSTSWSRVLVDKLLVTQLFKTSISGFRRDVDEIYSLLGYYGVVW